MKNISYIMPPTGWIIEVGGLGLPMSPLFSVCVVVPARLLILFARLFVITEKKEADMIECTGRARLFLQLATIVACIMCLQLYAGFICKSVTGVRHYQSQSTDYEEALGTGRVDEYEHAEARCLNQIWVQRHAELQRSMLAGERPARFLVLQPECGYCGIGNRLNSILGTYMLAVLLGRALVIDWVWEGRRPFPVNTKYFRPNVVDWEAQSAVGTPYFKSDPERTRKYVGWGETDYLRDVLERTNFTEFHEPDAVLFHWIGESPSISLRKNPLAKELAVDAGLMTEDTEWDEAWDEEFKKCAVRALFKPTPFLEKAYCTIQGGAAARGVGIHVRTGDDRTWNVEFKDPKDEHLRFARCAEGMRRAFELNITVSERQGLTSRGSRLVDMSKWHIASDYQGVVDDVRKAHPRNIESMDSLDALKVMGETSDEVLKVRHHSANTPHEQFSLGPLLDLLLLSSGVAVVGTCRSTFSASATYFGMIPPAFTLLRRTNFEARYFHSSNCPEMPELAEAEETCMTTVATNKPLLEDVLRTPPFIQCPARIEDSTVEKQIER